MNKEPSLEERLSEDSTQTTTAPTSTPTSPGLLGKIANHAKYFVVDGTGYAAFYGLAMIIAEPFLMDWEKVKKTRGIGLITGFLSGYFVNLLRGILGKEKNGNVEEGSSINFKKLAADAVVGTVTTVPFYAPILYYANNSKLEGMEVPLVFGSMAAGLAGAFYGGFADWWRRRCNLPGVLYK